MRGVPESLTDGHRGASECGSPPPNSAGALESGQRD
jgi:hypothetical protein